MIGCRLLIYVLYRRRPQEHITLIQHIPERTNSAAATIDIGGWPSGHGGAIAQFWVDPAQPHVVRERFGVNGENLRGPLVDEFDDGTPRLRVYRAFEIPLALGSSWRPERRFH